MFCFAFYVLVGWMTSQGIERTIYVYMYAFTSIAADEDDAVL